MQLEYVLRDIICISYEHYDPETYVYTKTMTIVPGRDFILAEEIRPYPPPSRSPANRLLQDLYRRELEVMKMILGREG